MRAAASSAVRSPAPGVAGLWKMRTVTADTNRSIATGREPTARAVIGLGANLGDAAATIRDAIRALDELPGARVAAVSRLYATAPVGVTDQPEFRNAAALVDVPAGTSPETGAVGLLVALKGLERRFGRRARRRWGPREIDLDLLAFGPHAIAVDRPPEGQSLDFQIKGAKLLVVPHPAADGRLFVLAPWADVTPDDVPPGWSKTVAQARDRRLRVEGAQAVRPLAAWDVAGREWAPIEGAR
jgi:2-amino-4-hydroxy-6-hydroxymethyldihydropteridine diphosphokinase